MMRNIAYLISKTYMSFNEIMNLPYAIFLSLLKQFQVMELEEDPNYREQLHKQSLLEKKEPDIGKMKSMGLLKK